MVIFPLYLLGENGYTSGFLKIAGTNDYRDADVIPCGVMTSLASNSGLINIPNQNRAILITAGWTSARKQQAFIDIYTATLYTRDFYNDNWSSWKSK